MSCRSQNSPKTSTSTNVQPTLQSSMYLVFESALLMLFVTCRFCTSTTTNVKKSITGSFLRVTQYCTVCKRTWSWESQPLVGTIPAGNILTSAAILFSGAFPAKVLRIFQILKCAMITPKTFFRHQAKFLQPAVHIAWEKHQMALFQSFKANNQNLALSGDGRADSPGHSAKYGSYTVMEMSCNKVLDFKLVQVYLLNVAMRVKGNVNNVCVWDRCLVQVCMLYRQVCIKHSLCVYMYVHCSPQSNEVGGSYHMEKEGLARVLNFLQQQGLNISVLVTDRHRQINKWLRENHSEITHYYDVWHVAKGNKAYSNSFAIAILPVSY